MKRLLPFAPLVLLVVLSGCGSGTATVNGKVTYRGRPVTSGSVIVVNADGTAESGVIQPDGTYSVEGVKRGWVKVGVFSPDPAHARSILMADENRAKMASRKTTKKAPRTSKIQAGGWFPLPHNLGDPESSGLGCDVAESHVHYDLDMK
jgi:hypothetical protein